ncbi:MAG: hypothetical protein MZV63_47840 [Marinilabiliales bacterium]|nr:hypothetical protein [Marinilabiliales bacterium]
MHRMGIRSFIDPVFSIFLGTSDLSLEEMVGAYGTFANKGVYTRPLYVTRIEDRNGNVISTFTPFIDEVISEEHAYLMTSSSSGCCQHRHGTQAAWNLQAHEPDGRQDRHHTEPFKRMVYGRHA